MTALLPENPAKFVAQAQNATNSCDVDWAMSVYAPNVELETFGDGLHEVNRGSAQVRRAVTVIYDWLGSMDSHITKTLVAASGDAIVNIAEARLFGGTKIVYASEFWYFDETGAVIRNVIYQSMDPRSFRHPKTAVGGLILHPRLGLRYVCARARTLHQNRSRSK
ncbi:MAG: hypothetical protein ACR2LX_12120 [Jatrophihabitans sp.]